jgi:phage anti-repressor protein
MTDSKKITFKDFLKLNSFLEHKFIDEFFENVNIHNKINVNVDKIIDLDKIINWIGVGLERRFKIKNKLKKSYIENKDYIIEKVMTNNNQEEVKYFISMNLAKDILQQSRTVIGSQVRNYFIEIERVLFSYYMHIIDSLEKKEQELLSGKKT